MLKICVGLLFPLRQCIKISEGTGKELHLQVELMMTHPSLIIGVICACRFNS